MPHDLQVSPRLDPLRLIALLILAWSIDPARNCWGLENGAGTVAESGVANVNPPESVELEQLEQEAFRLAAERVAPSMVRIETIGGLEKVEGEVIQHATTSGIVVDEDGSIVSSAFNFVQQPSSILVTLPSGKRVSARIVARDLGRMIVLLKVDTEERLRVPVVAPVEEVVVGAWGIAVSRSISEEDLHITAGIISAKRRVWGKAIQTDANVSPANYGGALVDIQGRVIGVLVPLSPDASDVVAGAEWYDSGIGFAIPLETLLKDLNRLRQGDLLPGKMGISLKGSDIYGLPAEIGVSQPNSPARNAGIQAGDKIVQANGIPIATQADFKYVLGPLYAGDELRLVLARGDRNERIETSVVLTDKLLPYEHPYLGILPVRRQVSPGAEEPVGQSNQQAAESADNVDAPMKQSMGVVVRDVLPNSPASQSDLRPADRIVRWGDTEVNGIDSLYRLLASHEPNDEVTLGVVSTSPNSTDEPAIREISVRLGPLDPQVPPSASAPFPEVNPPNEGLPPLGKIEVKLPEEAGLCSAYVPQTYDPRFLHGLLVLLPQPGKSDMDSVIGTWKQVCDDRRVILLLPQAKESRNWLPTETAFVRKTIENMVKRYRIDNHRIAITGTANSGSMAYLVALKERDLIRGVAVLDSPVPRRAPAIFNEPLQRLFFYIANSSESPLRERIQAEVKMLRDAKFPVLSTQIEGKGEFGPSQRAELLRWIDGLDRI